MSSSAQSYNAVSILSFLSLRFGLDESYEKQTGLALPAQVLRQVRLQFGNAAARQCGPPLARFLRKLMPDPADQFLLARTNASPLSFDFLAKEEKQPRLLRSIFS